MAPISAVEETGIRNEGRIDALEKDFAEFKKEVKACNDKVWEAISEIRNDLMNRLPPWATWTLTIFGTVVGVLVTLAVKR